MVVRSDRTDRMEVQTQTNQPVQTDRFPDDVNSTGNYSR
jgi:hypothetical protein